MLFFAAAAAPAVAADGGSGLTGTTGTLSTPTPSSNSASSVVTPQQQVKPVVSVQHTTAATQQTVVTQQPAAKSASSAFGSRVLKLGMSGSDVTALQHDLTALNFKVSATGVFTTVTLQKLKQFQRRYGLTVDGQAGPSSIGELKKLLSSNLHIAESALQAKELSAGQAITATASNQPLPAGDSGTGGASIDPASTTTTTTTTTSSVEQNATLIDGLAVPAPGTPQTIVNMINAANKIAFDPYIYGGGHASFNAAGYDCSGTVSYVLHAGGLLATPLDSEQFVNYGLPGKGSWITIYTNGPTHAYMEIAGLWFDTAAQTAANGNDRWSSVQIAEPGYGKFVPRHPAGW